MTKKVPFLLVFAICKGPTRGSWVGASIFTYSIPYVVCVHVHVIYIYVFIYVLYTFICSYTCVFFVCICMCIYICIFTYIKVYTRVYAYLYELIHSQPCHNQTKSQDYTQTTIVKTQLPSTLDSFCPVSCKGVFSRI